MNKDYTATLVSLLSMTAMMAFIMPWAVNMRVIQECGDLNPTPLGFYQARENNWGMYECHLNE